MYTSPRQCRNKGRKHRQRRNTLCRNTPGPVSRAIGVQIGIPRRRNTVYHPLPEGRSYGIFLVRTRHERRSCGGSHCPPMPQPPEGMPAVALRLRRNLQLNIRCLPVDSDGINGASLTFHFVNAVNRGHMRHDRLQFIVIMDSEGCVYCHDIVDRVGLDAVDTEVELIRDTRV